MSFWFYRCPEDDTDNAWAGMVWQANEVAHIACEFYENGTLHENLLIFLTWATDVKILLDRRCERVADPLITELRAAGALVRFDKKHKRMLESSFTTDSGWAAFGSYKPLFPGKAHQMSSLIYSNESGINTYLDTHFLDHWAHSVEV